MVRMRIKYVVVSVLVNYAFTERVVGILNGWVIEAEKLVERALLSNPTNPVFPEWRNVVATMAFLAGSTLTDGYSLENIDSLFTTLYFNFECIRIYQQPYAVISQGVKCPKTANQ